MTNWSVEDLQKAMKENPELGIKGPPPPKGSTLEIAFAAGLKLHKLPEAVREHRFHKSRRWRIDFAWSDQKIAVELEGGVWGTGRPCPTCGQRRSAGHQTGTGYLKDIEKYNALTLSGWKLYRAAEPHITDASIFELLKEVLS